MRRLDWKAVRERGARRVGGASSSDGIGAGPGLTLLATGLVAGATLAYFFDPRTGQLRRLSMRAGLRRWYARMRATGSLEDAEAPVAVEA